MSKTPLVEHMLPMHNATVVARKASALLAGMAGGDSAVLSVKPLAGGDINQAWKISTKHHSYFLKCNRSGVYPRLFELEASGLRLLASTGSVVVPEVVACRNEGDLPCLILEYVEPGTPTNALFAEAGRALASLHRHSSPVFGLSADNYIGTLPQSNGFESGFPKFFTAHRLIPLAQKAVDSALAPASLLKALENLRLRLSSLLPEEPPALVHGDLWRGNLMFSSGNQPVFIDPAVYYGHRETDLAMTRLFGGFPQVFYDAYHESFPLSSGWKNRIGLFNLYPLLVHLNLFGGGYVGQIEQILARM